MSDVPAPDPHGDLDDAAWLKAKYAEGAEDLDHTASPADGEGETEGAPPIDDDPEPQQWLESKYAESALDDGADTTSD